MKFFSVCQENASTIIMEASSNHLVDYINSLQKLHSTGKVSKSEISKAEKELGLKFAKDYKEYLEEFGKITADGIELTGICKSAHANVVKATQSEWKMNEEVPHDMYLIEKVDEIFIWQDSSGSIYQTSTSSNKPKKINSSLLDYLKNNKNLNIIKEAADASSNLKQIYSTAVSAFKKALTKYPIIKNKVKANIETSEKEFLEKKTLVFFEVDLKSSFYDDENPFMYAVDKLAKDLNKECKFKQFIFRTETGETSVWLELDEK